MKIESEYHYKVPAKISKSYWSGIKIGDIVLVYSEISDNWREKKVKHTTKNFLIAGNQKFNKNYNCVVGECKYISTIKRK